MIGARAADVAVGVDVGGTTIKAVAVDLDGHVIARRTVPTFANEEPALASLHSVLEGTLTAARGARYRPTAIGVCTPGIVNSFEGTVTFAANLGWQDLPLAAEIGARHGVPVHVEHDARAAATAELRARGEDRADSSMLFVPLGTGVSAAITFGGTSVAGSVGAAGELGHMIVQPGGEPCSCGQSGCVEAYAGAHSILRRYRAHGGTARNVEEIVSKTPRDAIARHVWDDAIDALARGIHGATSIMDPSLIVLGGGVSRAGDRLLVPLRRRLESLLTWRATPRVSLSRLQSFGGVVGATLLAAPDLTADNIDTLVLDLTREPNAPISSPESEDILL